MRVTAPARPSLGVLFGVALAAWAAASAGEELTWELFVGAWSVSQVVVGSCLCLAAGAVIAIAWRAWRSHILRSASTGRLGSFAASVDGRSLAVLALSFLAAFGCAVLYWQAWASDRGDVRDATGGEELVLELVGDASARDYGEVSVARTTVEGRTVTLRLLWPEDVEPLPAGHAVSVTGSFSAAEDDDGGRWNHRQGYVGMFAATSAVGAGYASGLRGILAPFRDASFERISTLGAEPAGLLAGVLLGNRTLYAGTELEQDFRTTGLAHLMAVSGTHLAVVTALLSFLLARTRLPKAARCAVVCSCLVLYVGLTCMSPSAMRSCVMCMTAFCAGLVGRRKHVLSALSLAVLLFVCLSPSTAFSTGFVLSVLSVGGLVLLSPLVEAWLSWALPRRLEGLCGPFAATISATLATLPVTVSMFSQLPLISPLSTLLVSPLVTLALGLGVPALLLCALLPGPGMLLLSLAGAVASATSALVHALADLPGACLPVEGDGTLIAAVYVVSIAAVWALWPLPPGLSDEPPSRAVSSGAFKRAALAVCLLAPLAVVLLPSFGGAGATITALDPRAESGPEVVMIDVGQGDCMLIRDGDAAVLVDTGEDDQLLQEGLARNGVTHLDAVFITHKDADHCGALSSLAGVVGVEHVYVHAGLLGGEYVEEIEEDARWVTDGGELEGVWPGTVTQIGSFSMTLLGPDDPGESDNEDSLVNLLEYDEDGDGEAEARAFLTGDAEADSIEEYVDEVGDVDVLKVAHHGSRESATEEELDVLSPQVALIGVGADNTYGHPTEEMLARLEACNAKVYRTDEDGDVTLVFSGGSIGVGTQK